MPVAPTELPLGVQLNYFSGGADGAGARLRGSACWRARSPAFAGYDEFSFEPPREPGADGEGGDDRRSRATATRGWWPTSCR